MKSFDQWMTRHQIEWRKANVKSKERGRWQGRQYPWILPESLWEEGLWAGIRTGSGNSLPAYLESTGVQKHGGVHNLKSSWVLCANLYFPFRSAADGKALFASFLKRRVAMEIDSLEEIELEYAEDGELHPSRLLGEEGGTRGANQTSPDLGLLVNGAKGWYWLRTSSPRRASTNVLRGDTRVVPGGPATPIPTAAIALRRL